MRRDAERNVERDLVASVPVLVVRDLSERRSKRTRSHRENVHSGFGQTFVVKLHLNVVRSPRTGTVISLELLRLPTRRVQKTAERILETFLKLDSYNVSITKASAEVGVFPKWSLLKVCSIVSPFFASSEEHKEFVVLMKAHLISFGQKTIATGKFALSKDSSSAF